jgi:hypothetical protein
MGKANFKKKLEKYFHFELKEVEHLLAMAIVFGFVMSFGDWGAASFDFAAGVFNLITSFIVCFISLFAIISAKKVAAIYYGHILKSKVWDQGLIVAVLVGILTNGKLPLILGGSFELELASSRKLTHRMEVKTVELARVAMVGLFTSAVIISVTFALRNYAQLYAFDQLILFNALHMGFSLLPHPKLDGSKIFFHSTTIYTFVMVGSLTFLLTSLLSMPSFILAFGAGTIGAVMLYFLYEAK